MRFTKAHRRFLLIDQCAIPAFINLVANGLISWLLNRSTTAIPIWGSPSVSIDLLLTGFLLPFLICVITSRQIKGRVRQGTLEPIPQGRLPILQWFRRPAWVRGLMLAVSGVFLAAMPVVIALTLAQGQAFPTLAFVGFKALWSMMLAAVVSPIIAWWALANASLQVAQRVQVQSAPPSVR